jgi:carboxyl-terminal processing protease
MQVDCIDGIMIDLRNNGGGALFEAINLSGLFIPGGPIVQVKYKNGRIEKGTDEDKSMFYEGPMNVMINRFSASASEIFAGAMQDYKRGVIVGEQTYGKGTVQNVRGINDFLNGEKDTLGLIKYTIAKFYRVNGSSTQHMGVSPDIALPSAFDAKEFGESSRPSALKWDQIASAKYTPLNYVDKRMLDYLNESNDERLKSDQSLVDLQSDIADLKAARSKLVVSLNYEVRKEERDTAEKKRAARVKVGASLNELDANKVTDRSLDDLKDPYLKESIILLAEQIAFAKKKG